MSLNGKVISINDDKTKAKVLVKPVLNCNGCKACAGLIKNSNVANKEYEIEVLVNNLSIEAGDFVNVELSEFQGSKVAFIIYGIPIVGFLIGMFSAPFICNIINIPISDLCRIIFAFLGLFLSFIIVFYYQKSKGSDSLCMSITKKINKE